MQNFLVRLNVYICRYFLFSTVNPLWFGGGRVLDTHSLANRRMLKDGCSKAVGMYLTLHISTLKTYSTKTLDFFFVVGYPHFGPWKWSVVSLKMRAPVLPMTPLFCCNILFWSKNGLNMLRIDWDLRVLRLKKGHFQKEVSQSNFDKARAEIFGFWFVDTLWMLSLIDW